jgi:NAD-dependent SIR2 family protein deacetylase
MCATCGCLTTTQPAPETGTYKCVECEEAGQRETVTVQKGDKMPSCNSCGKSKVHWVRA